MTSESLEKLLGDVFDQERHGHLPDRIPQDQYEVWKRDFVFHMTDWMDDLERLRSLLKNPQAFGTDSASLLIFSCLIHIIPHLNAAGRLLMGEVPDTFVDHGTERHPKGSG